MNESAEARLAALRTYYMRLREYEADVDERAMRNMRHNLDWATERVQRAPGEVLDLLRAMEHTTRRPPTDQSDRRADRLFADAEPPADLFDWARLRS